MKSEAIMKINKMGKVTYILAKITKICLIIGIVAVTVAMIMTAFITRDSVKLNVGGTADMIVDVGAFGRLVHMSDIGSVIEAAEVNGEISGEGTLNLGDNVYALVSTEIAGDKVIAHYAYSDIELGMRNLIIVLVGALMEVIITLVLVRHGEALCKAFRDCDNPFEANIIAKMKKLTIALIVWLVLSGTAESMTKGAINGKVNIVVGVDIPRVLIALFCIVVMYAFRYGAELQQQADETL